MKHESNTKFVTRIMESNPLVQLVVIQALCTYTAQVLADEKEFLAKMTNNPLISGHTWIGAVKELKGELDIKYPG